MVWIEIAVMGLVAMLTWVGANFPDEHHDDLPGLQAPDHAAG